MNLPENFINAKADGSVRLKLHVRPGGRKNAFTGIFGDSLKLELQTPPVDGKANAALLKFIASFFDLSKSAVTLVAGESCRDKIVDLSGISPQTVINKLNELES